MTMTDEIRRTLFQQAIESYLAKGYRVVSRDQWSATLRKETEVNWLAFILLLGVFYHPFYAAKRSHTVTITIDINGRLRTGDGAWLPSFPVEVGRAVPPVPTTSPDVPQSEATTAGRYQILCICRENGAISHIGFRDEIGVMQRMTKQDAVAGIVQGRLAFFVASNDIPADVMVVGSPGHQFLKTEADDTSGNNLSHLPDCQSVEVARPSQSPAAITKHPKDVLTDSMPAAFDHHNHSIHVTGENTMGTVSPYHTILDSDKPRKVYHYRNDCPKGKQIKEEDRMEGTGGRDKCWECAQLDRIS
jgi:hypothetical protein